MHQVQDVLGGVLDGRGAWIVTQVEQRSRTG
jgi:hypothetical protein